MIWIPGDVNDLNNQVEAINDIVHNMQPDSMSSMSISEQDSNDEEYLTSEKQTNDTSDLNFDESDETLTEQNSNNGSIMENLRTSTEEQEESGTIYGQDSNDEVGSFASVSSLRETIYSDCENELDTVDEEDEEDASDNVADESGISNKGFHSQDEQIDVQSNIDEEITIEENTHNCEPPNKYSDSEMEQTANNDEIEIELSDAEITEEVSNEEYPSGVHISDMKHGDIGVHSSDEDIEAFNAAKLELKETEDCDDDNLVNASVDEADSPDNIEETNHPADEEAGPSNENEVTTEEVKKCCKKRSMVIFNSFFYSINHQSEFHGLSVKYCYQLVVTYFL